MFRLDLKLALLRVGLACSWLCRGLQVLISQAEGRSESQIPARPFFKSHRRIGPLNFDKRFFEFILKKFDGTWRSLVARTLGVREVAGSNPVVPTITINHLRRSVTVAAGRLWGKLRGLFSDPQDSPSHPLVRASEDGCIAWPCERLTNP